MKTIIALLGVITLTACVSDTAPHSQIKRLESTEEITPVKSKYHLAALSINANITPQVYDEYLNELRALNIKPLVGLPGNVILVSGNLRAFTPGALSLPTTLHQRTTAKTWTTPPDLSADWHRTFNPKVQTDHLLLGQEDVRTIQGKIKRHQRPLSFRVAARTIDRQPGQGDGDESRVNVPDAYSMIDGLKQSQRMLLAYEQAPKTLPKTHTLEQIKTERLWTEQFMQTMQKSTPLPGIQGPKFGLNRITLAVFFPESTNMGNENWSSGEIDHQLTELNAGLISLLVVAPRHTNLYFDMVIHGHNNSINHIGYEPTYFVNEIAWINELLQNAGIPGSILGHIARNNAYESVVAQSTNAAHATSVFIVRDAEPPYADFNNPHMTGWPHAIYNGYYVSTSNNGASTHIHELLHTLNAHDQYANSFYIDPCVNTSPHGHDRAVWAGSPSWSTNGNHAKCNAHANRHNSNMLGAGLTTDYNTQERITLDWYSRAAIGWGNTAQLIATTETLNPQNLGGEFSPPAFVQTGHAYNEAHTSPYDQANIFQYVETNTNYPIQYPLCLSRELVIGSWVSAPSFWFPQGTSIVPTAHCDNTYTSLASIQGSGPSEIDGTSPTTLGSGGHEGLIYVHTETYEPAPKLNLDCSRQASWRDQYPFTAVPTPMGCYVRKAEQAHKPFIYNNNYYVEYHDYCKQGEFSPWGCVLFRTSSSNLTFFVSTDKKTGFVINRTHPTQCPFNGSYWYTVQNSAVCMIATASPDTELFLDTSVTLSPLMQTPSRGCAVGVDDLANCHLGAPPSGTTAKLDAHRFYYIP